MPRAKKIDLSKMAELLLQTQTQLRDLQEQETAEPLIHKPAATMPLRRVSRKEEDVLLEMARQSLRQFGTILPPKEALYAQMDGECPHCGHVGPLATDFGFKKYKGTVRPQSWCRFCRAGTDSHPSRKSR